jgi:hypothetical protein
MVGGKSDMTNIIQQQPLISALIALQFVAFGWRINREIPLGDQGRRTWLPAPDFLNLLSLVAVMIFCVALPLAFRITRATNTVLAIGYTFIAFHPINEAAHYRLFSRKGRSIYTDVGRDYPWITDQEIFTVIISLILAFVFGIVAWSNPPNT